MREAVEPLITALLEDDLEAVTGALDEERWRALQDAALARQDDAGALAHQLLCVMVRRPRTRGEALIGDDALAWTIEWAPDTVRYLLDLDDWFERHELIAIMDRLPGAAGVWAFREVVERWPHHGMRDVADLTEEDRIARLRVIAEGGEVPHAFGALSASGVTEATIPWVLRVVFGQPEPPGNWEIHRIGRLVLHDCGFVPRRASVPWDVAARRPRELRLLLLAWTDDAEAHARVVAEALAAGEVTAAVAETLGPEGDRPLWLSGEEPWRYAGVRDAGTVRLPDGRLAACDPLWGRETPIPIVLAPGSYAVALATATHPFHPGEGSAALVLAVSGAPVARWEPAEQDEYVPDTGGVACFGAVSALETREEITPVDVYGYEAATETRDLGDAGTVVMASIADQHPTCRTWIGRDAGGAIARVLTDLGLMGLDPVADPALPWETEAY